MKKYIFFVSTQWGGNTGGINIFNKSLVESFARVASEEIQIVSVVSDLNSLPQGSHNNITFLTYEGNSRSLAEIIAREVSISGPKTEIYILGHDIHTGNHVVEARDILREKNISSEALHFCHMDYSAYDFLKIDKKDYLEKVEPQRKLIMLADKVFSVGPLLKQNFDKLRSKKHQKSPIVEVIPGFPEKLQNASVLNPSNALKFFFSGRIGKEIDEIKNSRPTLRAILEAYKEASKNSENELWKQPGIFKVYGFPRDENIHDWFYDSLKSEANKFFQILLEDFSEQEEMFRHLLDSHIAIMPSAHEGFGLSGWEAVCAGIPLILTKNSGLNQFLLNLFMQEHLLPRESIVTINGRNIKDNVDELKEAITKTVANYERSKSHAAQLSSYLRERYSWDECASIVASSIGVLQRGSVKWQKRRDYQKYSLQSEVLSDVENAITKTKDGLAFKEWSLICTALNFINDVSNKENFASLNKAHELLVALAENITASYRNSETKLPAIRSTGRFDIAWRFMAASSGIYRSFSEFIESIPEDLMNEIKQDNFLVRELLYYSMKYSPSFSDRAFDFSKEFFHGLGSEFLRGDCYQKRIARLEASFPDLEKLQLFGDYPPEEYLVEKKLCSIIKDDNFEFIDLFSGNDCQLVATFIALSSYDNDIREKGIDRLFNYCEKHGLMKPGLQWRGDKLLLSSMISSIATPNFILDLVSVLSGDEDESLRWAAIDLAFSQPLRSRLFNATRNSSLNKTPKQIKQHLGSAVDRAIEIFNFHPWMQREFLERYLNEHSNSTLELCDRYTLLDFPIARKLVGELIENDSKIKVFEHLHPEVSLSRNKLLEHIKRVLLVLPPINLEEKIENKFAKTSTPPLGLGIVGSALLSFGHDVQLADCHRFPEMSKRVVEFSKDFQFLGFNSVISTARSVIELSVNIKSVSNSPVIIIGGPSVNSGAFANSAKNEIEKQSWDYEIISNVEENFLKIINMASFSDVSLPLGLIPNPKSQYVLSIIKTLPSEAKSLKSNHDWYKSFTLDRRIYSTQEVNYEPQQTRALNSNIVEAHVVMSRGCDWNCTFCTERLELSKGEIRRPITQVKEEILEIAANFPSLRIQFVDDNLFPQIAAFSDKRIKVEHALDWAKELFVTLKDVNNSTKDSFGWRGIMRVEDFLAYEREIPNYISELKLSGCRMLAFGVEHGNETKRKKMKSGGSASNEEFKKLFGRLRDAGIHSKAYFILGGPKETLDSCEETIQFAIECGVSIAYFAIYKEFVPAVKILNSEQAKNSTAYSKYSQYECLKIEWDDIFEKGMRDRSDEVYQETINIISCDDTAFDVSSIPVIYDELTRLGFRFSDLVKYNDHHASKGDSIEILEKVNLGNQKNFEEKLLSAYSRFYLRKQFLATYSSLLEAGY